MSATIVRTKPNDARILDRSWLINMSCGDTGTLPGSIQTLALPELGTGNGTACLQTVFRQRVIERISDHVLAAARANRLTTGTGLNAAATAEFPTAVDELLHRLVGLEDDQNFAFRRADLKASAGLRHVHVGVFFGFVVVNQSGTAGATNQKAQAIGGEDRIAGCHADFSR